MRRARTSKSALLAIGNRGQNAKLAAKLTGYKIDIKAATPENEALIAEKVEEAKAELAAKAEAEAKAKAEEEAAQQAQAEQDAEQTQDAASWEEKLAGTECRCRGR